MHSLLGADLASASFKEKFLLLCKLFACLEKRPSGREVIPGEVEEVISRVIAAIYVSVIQSLRLF